MEETTIDYKAELIKLVEHEIEMLQGFIDDTSYGGWSTHLNSPINKRIVELKAMHFRLIKGTF